MIKTKALLPQAIVNLDDFGFPVDVLFLPGTNKLFGFPVFWLWILWVFPMKIMSVPDEDYECSRWRLFFVSLCYFTFSFVSLLFGSFRFRFGNFLLSCLLSTICYLLKENRCRLFHTYMHTYRHISFIENTLENKIEQD